MYRVIIQLPDDAVATWSVASTMEGHGLHVTYMASGAAHIRMDVHTGIPAGLSFVPQALSVSSQTMLPDSSQN